MSNCRVIALTNQKGGVGKTTTALNLGIGLANTGKRVLLIDSDPQGSLTAALGWKNSDGLEVTLSSIYGMLLDDKLPKTPLYGILHSQEGVDLLPCDIMLSGTEMALMSSMCRESHLKRYIEFVQDGYDYILIDAPPTLGGWVMNILCASDEIIIPVESTPWGLFGLGNMFEFLEEVRQITPDLKLGGIVITKVDTRKSYFKQTLETLKSLEDVPVFDTYIRVDSGIEWSQDNNAPIMAYKKSSRSATEYMELTKEIAKME